MVVPYKNVKEPFIMLVHQLKREWKSLMTKAIQPYGSGRKVVALILLKLEKDFISAEKLGLLILGVFLHIYSICFSYFS